MKMAPNRPPLHAQNGTFSVTRPAGMGSRVASANSAMQIVPTR